MCLGLAAGSGLPPILHAPFPGINLALKDMLALRVQVPNNHILTQNHYYNSYYPNPKYLIIGYSDPKP